MVEPAPPPSDLPYEPQVMHWQKEVSSFRRGLLLTVPPQERAKWIAHRQLGDFRTFSAGYYEKAQGHQIERQDLDEGIFIYVKAGRGFYRSQGRSWEVATGDLLYCPPRSAHQYGAASEDPWTIYWVHVSGPRLKLYERMMELSPEEPLIHLGVQQELIYLFEMLLRYFYPVPTPAQCLSMQNCVQHLLAHAAALQRQCPGRSPQALAIQRVIAFMEERLAQGITLDDLARRFGASPAHFCKVFHKHAGEPPQRYFHRLQMRHACMILGSSDQSIRQVAEALGFEDPFYFSRLFKKQIGLSPEHYRQSLRS